MMKRGGGLLGGGLEGGKTTSDHSGTDNEPTEHSLLGEVLSEGRFRDGPEEDRAEGVEHETGDDGLLVTVFLEDPSGYGGVCEVSDTEVGDLETGGLEFGDIEDVLGVAG